MRFIEKESRKVETITVHKNGCKPYKSTKVFDKDISVEIEVDNITQKYELAEFLKQKGFHQSNGMMGTQRDFGIWMNENTHMVKLQFKNERRFKRLCETALEWFNLNSK